MASAFTLADALRKRLTGIERTRSKMEKLFYQGGLSRRDIEAVYEGLYIGAITSLEGFLEDLFYQILVGNVSYSKNRVVPRVNFSSRQVLHEVILSGKRYVDWLPYNLTEERSRIYLRGGRPFTWLDKSDKDKIQKWLWTRNAIAHVSKHSHKVFQDNVIAGLTLPPRERSPAGYLRSQIRVYPTVFTRFESVTSDITLIAYKLTK